MAVLTIRMIPDEVYRALTLRAKSHGHSIESEALGILHQAVLGSERVKLGSVLQAISREAGLTSEDLALFDSHRGSLPARAARFEEQSR